MDSFKEFITESPDGGELFTVLSVDESDKSYTIKLNESMVDSVLTELTGADLNKGMEPKTKLRGRDIKVDLQSLEPNGVLVFNSTSGTIRDGKKHWVQVIQMLEWNDYFGPGKEGSNQDKARLALLGELKVHCNCPAFLYYGNSYILTQYDSKLGKPENRPPNERNPKMEGTVCKHLSAIIKKLMVYAPKIAGILNRRG